MRSLTRRLLLRTVSDSNDMESANPSIIMDIVFFCTRIIKDTAVYELYALFRK